MEQLNIFFSFWKKFLEAAILHTMRNNTNVKIDLGPLPGPLNNTTLININLSVPNTELTPKIFHVMYIIANLFFHHYKFSCPLLCRCYNIKDYYLSFISVIYKCVVELIPFMSTLNGNSATLNTVNKLSSYIITWRGHIESWVSAFLDMEVGKNNKVYFGSWS